VEGGERFSAEDLVPQISRENVKKTERRQNRTRQSFLNFDIAVDNIGIGRESYGDKLVDVIAVKAFVEADLVEPGFRMKSAQ
jgi:hypothetical protein